MEINNEYIKTEVFQNFSLVCLQQSDKHSFKETGLKRLIEILLVILIVNF